MKRFLLGLSLVIGAWTLSPTPGADADTDANSWHKARRAEKYQVRVRPQKRGFGVPELDPGAAGGAIILVVGGVAYLASRRRKEHVA